MVIPNLSTASLRAATDPQSFQRGEKYYARRAVRAVDIFLTEGLLEDAMAVVDSDRYSYHSSLALRVMDAVFSRYPDWVIQQACQRADAIINRGNAKYYEQAVQWLKQARSAYFSSRRQADWQAYYTALQNTHRRKSKLVQLMEQSLS